MPNEPLRLLIIGAHPDDADYSGGGIAALYRSLGHVVRMISVTDGAAGHHINPGPEMVKRRRAEAAASGAIIGAVYQTWDIPDGGLLPTLENRYQVIRLIRTFKPDLLLTHRPNDYHPDHRYTSQLVQDAAYMVTVPAVVPDVPHLMRDPVIAYLPDDFQRPYPLDPAVVVDVGSVLEQIVDMLNCHVSQFYEWLAYNHGYLNRLPADPAGRRSFLGEMVREKLRKRANKYRGLLEKLYGPARGSKVEFAEAFEGCEYGAPLDDAARARLFPFVSP
jgi:N-acetylglucosamine malate deacetylase 1